MMWNKMVIIFYLFFFGGGGGSKLIQFKNALNPFKNANTHSV